MERAIGLIETKGLIAAVNGADAAIKAASVTIIKIEKIGSAYVTVVLRGDVAAVKAAVEAGVEVAAKYGEIIGANVIPRPHSEVEEVFSFQTAKVTTKKSQS